MLLTLNDDCLLSICEILEFTDQASIAQTNHRLKSIVRDVWQHNCKKVIISQEQCYYFHHNRYIFNEFMSCICRNVIQLEMHGIDRKYFKSLKSFEFPKITSFNGYIRSNDRTNTDADIKFIEKLFPRIQKLALQSNITGKDVWRLTNVTELKLAGCEILNPKYFKRIFSTLNLTKLDLMYHGYNTCFDERVGSIVYCKTLEELKIDDHHLMLFVHNLRAMKKLRKLVCYTRDYDTWLLPEISCYADTMETIIFDNVFGSKDEHCENVRSMRFLQKFILHDDDIDKNQLSLISENLGIHLKEVYYLKGRQGTCDDVQQGLLELLMNCKNLELLDISESHFGVDFLNQIIDTLGKINKDRRKALLFRCYDTLIKPEDTEFMSIPSFINISFKQVKTELPGTRCIQCEWKTEFTESKETAN